MYGGHSPSWTEGWHSVNMNSNYGDLFGGGAGTHGQDVSEANLVNSLRAFQQVGH